MVYQEDVERVRNLIAVDETISKQNSLNKDTAEFKARIIGFHNDYVEAGMTRVSIGYEFPEYLATRNFIAGVISGEIYVVNPSFLKEYYKEKWFK